jgi:hypothetical protein
MGFSKTQQWFKVMFSLFFFAPAPTTITFITQPIDAGHATCGKLVVYRYVRSEGIVLTVWPNPVRMKGIIILFNTGLLESASSLSLCP